MFPRLAWRVLRTTDAKAMRKFLTNFAFKGALSVERFKRRVKRGEYFPPFLYISLINSCNLRCQGCWVDVEAPREMLSLEELDRLIREAQEYGNSFFGLLGGEPFLHPDLLGLLAAHPDCYFQIFTNGQMITEKVARRLRELANATPLISIEGRELVSDERRGKAGVFNRSMRGLEHCVRERLLTGVATSLCRSNFHELLTREWLQELIARGVHYVWYHTYRPVGPKMTPDLALTSAQLRQAREFIVEMRAQMPIGIIDAYYDDRGLALCPMATGISHHISPRGQIEPCPIIQFAVDSLRSNRSARQAIAESPFLKAFRQTAASVTRGCIVLERPDLVRELVRQFRAQDTTIRGAAWAELEAMQPRPSQAALGAPIPEKHWMYRWAKKLWFNDFGAYRRLDARLPGSNPKENSTPPSQMATIPADPVGSRGIT